MCLRCLLDGFVLIMRKSHDARFLVFFVYPDKLVCRNLNRKGGLQVLRSFLMIRNRIFRNTGASKYFKKVGNGAVLTEK